MLGSSSCSEWFCKSHQPEKNIRELLSLLNISGCNLYFSTKTAKLGLSSQPDLFDDLECTLSYGSISSDMPFIREWKAVGKRTFLARDHKIFFAASDIVRFFLLNGSHILETKSLYDLLIKSINGLKK